MTDNRRTKQAKADDDFDKEILWKYYLTLFLGEMPPQQIELPNQGDLRCGHPFETADFIFPCTLGPLEGREFQSIAVDDVERKLAGTPGWMSVSGSSRYSCFARV